MVPCAGVPTVRVPEVRGVQVPEVRGVLVPEVRGEAQGSVGFQGSRAAVA